MKNLKKIFASILILVSFAGAPLAIADAYDPVFTFRNNDDTADTTTHVIGLDTSQYAVYGDRLNAPGVASAYYFSQWFNIAATSGALGTSNYKIDLDLGAFSPLDIGNLGDLLDAKLSKASNLSDLASVSTARTNLGLGTSATMASTAFATSSQGALADTALQNITGKISAGTNVSITGSGTTVSPYVINASGGTGTVTSVIAGTGLSGGTITTSGTISMPNVGTAGTYGAVTTDAQGRVTAGKRMETYSGTTNGSGVYTVTFSTAYSVAPNIQANLINGTDTQSSRITAISTTGFTVLIRNRTDVVGLLPAYANVTGASIDVLITEK